ncbi:MAG TPA: GNAT family N-acetyltransferase [Acidimicrobiia bacterium]|nr:GNAT family N-acetyltransferase [Acidimicrobiia bacterium]
MSPAEKGEFLRRSLQVFAAETATAAGIDREAALEQARKQMQSLLPDGPDTVGHRFCWIGDGSERVGQVWFGPAPVGGGAYIFDLEVDPVHRRKGHAARALDEVIAWARREEFPSVGRSVFDHNPGARRLYEAAGFALVGFRAGQTEMRLVL